MTGPFIRKGPALGTDNKILAQYLPSTTGLDTAAAAALGFRGSVHPVAASGGGWQWPAGGRPLYAGYLDWFSDGTGLARPPVTGSLGVAGGGMAPGDGFYF